MNLLRVLYAKLYIEGFEQKPANLESAKKAIELIHNFAKTNSMDPTVYDSISKYVEGAEIINMSHTKINELTDVSRFYPVMQSIYMSELRINKERMNVKLETQYKKYAISLGVMTAEQDLDDTILKKDYKELLNKVVSQPQEEKEVVQEEKEPVQEEKVAEPEEKEVVQEEIDPKQQEALEKYFAEFKKIAAYASRETQANDTIEEICHTLEGSKVFDSEIAVFLRFVYKSNDPFVVYNALLPTFDNKEKELASFDDTVALFETMARAGLHDEELTERLKTLRENPVPYKDMLNTLEKMLSPEQKQFFIEKSRDGSFGCNIITRMYQAGGANYREKIVENLNKIPGANKFEPTDDSFYVFYYGKNPTKYDIHPLDEKIKSMVAEIKDDPEYVNLLNEINENVLEGTHDFINHYYSVSETGASDSQRQHSLEATEHANKNHPGLVRCTNSALDVSKDYESFNNLILEAEQANLQYPQEDRDALKAIVKQIQEDNFFDFTNFAAEQGTKVYGLHRLFTSTIELKKAIKENASKEVIKEKYDAFKKAQKLSDKYIKIMEKFCSNNTVPGNISVTRNTTFSGVYRANFVPVSRLNGLYITMGLCNKYGMDINDFIDNPLKCQQQLTASQYTKNKLSAILENALEDIDTFDSFYNTPRNFDSLEAFYNVIGIGRPAEFFATTMPHQNPELRNPLVLSEQLSNTISKCMNVYSAIAQNQGKALANLMMYRKEDINPINICPVKVECFNPYTLKKMEEPVALKDYIMSHYSLEELTMKLSEVNKYYKLKDEKEGYGKAITELMSVVETLDYPSNVIGILKDCLTTGHSLAADFINEVEPTKKNLDQNFLDFYNKYSQLTVEALGFVGQEVDMIKELEIRTMKKPSEMKLDFYAEKITEYLKVCGVNLTKLGYESDTKGVSSFLSDYANDKFKNEYNIVLPEGLFDSLENDAKATYEKRFEVPASLIHTKEDQEMADYIASKFVGIDGVYVGKINVAEEIVENSTTINHSKTPLQNLIKKDPTYAKGITIRDNSATYSPLVDDLHRDDMRKLINEVKVSEDTTKGIVAVVNKMKEYNMFYGFNPDGEDSFKVYGFKKYYDAYKQLEKALKDGNLTEAYEIAKTCDQIKEEYHDVMDLCEKVFPQDGNHCSGNLSISRNTYCPLEFTARQQAMIQLNAVYQLANACNIVNVDVLDAIKDPSNLMNLLLKSEKERVVSYFTKETSGKTLAALMNGALISKYAVGRGVEALLNLDADPSLEEQNGVKFEAFNGLVLDGTNISNCFKCKDAKGNYVVDMDALKGYLLSGGNQTIDNYLVNNINVETGKMYQNSKTYEQILGENNQPLDEVLQNMIQLLADTTLECIRMEDRKNYSYYPIENMFAAASSSVLDIIRKNHLENVNTPIVALAKSFVRNPFDAVYDQMKQMDAEVALNVNAVINKTLVTKQLEANGLFESHAKDVFETFKTQVSRSNVDVIQQNYNNLRGANDNVVNPENLTEMLLMAKRLNDSFNSRGFFRRLFPAAGRERRLLATIVNDLNNAKIDGTLINDVLAGRMDNIVQKVTFEEDKLRETNIYKEYSVTNVTSKLETLLGDDETHISNENLTTAMQICKEIKDVLPNVSQNYKEELQNAFNLIQDTIENTNIPKGIQERIMSGELTAEEATLEAATLDNRIRQEISFEELDVDNGDVEPMMNDKELQEEIEIQKDIKS